MASILLKLSIKKPKYTIEGMILVILPVLAFFISLSIGRYPVSLQNVFSIMISQFLSISSDWTQIEEMVIINIRLPRVLLAMLVGSTLAVSGASFQGLFRNPLVSSHILGVAAGSGFGAAICMLFVSDSTYLIQLFAFVFGIIAVLGACTIARTHETTSILMLILGGIVVGAAFGYGRRKNIFEDINFKVDAGDNFSILGPNGCGKTTLLKSMLRILRLKNGAIHIDSKNINSMKRIEIGRKIGYVPQTHNSTFPYTVLQMVLMGRASHLNFYSSPSKKDIEIAEDALQTIGIHHLIEKSYTNISGGEAQLVLIARALTTQPDALLLDEPTSHLDFRNQIHILETLDALAEKKKIAIIMTTHYPNHALLVSNKALLLNNNKIVQGIVEDVITEANLKDTFGIDVRIIPYENGGTLQKTIVPVVNFKGGYK